MAEGRVAGAPAAAPLLAVRKVVKRYGALPVLHELSLDVEEGEFISLLGESGSGKTTLLRLIAGFERPDAGEIVMENERIDALPPYRRRVNTVFQHYALFPHLDVFENVAYGLRVQGVPRAEIQARVGQALEMMKMNAFVHAAPARLSGGQQQRVALARALVNRPRLLLLDEPLSALDANLRRQMQQELKALQRELGIAFLFVTHDQEEAMALSDRIALLRAGTLEQVASPREIYRRPATAYAAEFIGRTNLLRGRTSGGRALIGPSGAMGPMGPMGKTEGTGGAASLTWPCSLPDGPVAFSLRPEYIRPLAPAGGAGEQAQAASGMVRFRAAVRRQSFQGATELLELDLGGDLVLRALIQVAGPGRGEAGALSEEFGFAVADAVPVQDNGAGSGRAS
jgi:ABC-type Fe3+/spermidine/putrescine transport system ATPase subunit